jgi:cell division protein FtsZ
VSSGQDRAREAAEAAVNSPLLEDIDLMGANGILVNVTAGLDLAIGEFEEVGNTVKEFASRDATVVVGTVIDPEMHDELRVTVVATGLASQLETKQEKPEPVKLVQRKKTGEVDYTELDRPAVIRRKASGDPMPPPKAADDMDYLDIPAFLRRQAD